MALYHFHTAYKNSRKRKGYGKISVEVHKPNGVLTIKYNALDQKVSQSTSRNDSIVTEYFVYDPSGNVLASYGDTIKIQNFNVISHKFSLRIGTLEADSLLWKDGSSNIATVSGVPKFALKLGLKRYELSNHLSNVSTVISDRKILQGNGQITAYKADIVSVTDYYAYGMKIIERTWGKDARYQYNGKEQDKGMGRYNFDGRMYDERSCRWMSLDPKAAKYVSFSPYSYTGGSPMAHIEVDGGYFIGINGEKVTVGKDKDGKWVLSDNASSDLQKMVTLINNSKSPLAMRIFGIVANNNTKINFKFVEESINNKNLLGLHQPHDAEGKILTWNSEKSKFEGSPEFIDTKADRFEYKEASISIFLDNFNEDNMDFHDVEATTVAIFSHESFHDIEQKELKSLLQTGHGEDIEGNAYMIEYAVIGEQIKNKGLKPHENDASEFGDKVFIDKEINKSYELLNKNEKGTSK